MPAKHATPVTAIAVFTTVNLYIYPLAVNTLIHLPSNHDFGLIRKPKETGRAQPE